MKNLIFFYGILIQVSLFGADQHATPVVEANLNRDVRSADATEVRDFGNLFSSGALKIANFQIEELRKQFHTDVLIETHVGIACKVRRPLEWSRVLK